MDTAQIQSLISIAAIALIAVGLVGLAAIAGRSAVTGLKRRARLSGRGHAATQSPSHLAAEALASLTRGVQKLGDKVEDKDPTQQSQLRLRLAQAGFSAREAVPIYIGARTVTILAAIGATLLLLPYAVSGGGGLGAIVIAAAFAGAAMLGPDQVLRARRTKLEREYRDGFPDLLDLLVASTEAGLSMDAAVSRITGELVSRYPSLAEHLRMMSLELRAGRSRKEAWSRFADRLGIEEARSFATMLRQAEDMGVSLGETLQVFSDDMRTKRMLRAEEKALALPAKLVVPLILFIFPCLLGVLILPAAIHVAQALHH